MGVKKLSKYAFFQHLIKALFIIISRLMKKKNYFHTEIRLCPLLVLSPENVLSVRSESRRIENFKVFNNLFRIVSRH